VRIAGWSSARQKLPNEEETRPEKDKDAFNKKENMN
jgi:hypothetical protein